jgi:hypothetical protein
MRASVSSSLSSVKLDALLPALHSGVYLNVELTTMGNTRSTPHHKHGAHCHVSLVPNTITDLAVQLPLERKQTLEDMKRNRCFLATFKV